MDAGVNLNSTHIKIRSINPFISPERGYEMVFDKLNFDKQTPRIIYSDRRLRQ